MLPSHITIRKSERARRLALRLDPKTRTFDLVVPKGMSMRKAHAFAESRERWMQECLSDLPESIAFCDGAVLPLFGKDRTIDVCHDPVFKRTKITLTENYLEVRTNQDDPSARIARFIKKIAKEELERLSLIKAAEIGKEVSAVSVRDTKSRWGSCSASGKISYSWRLIFAPYESLDYVVAHEVAHLEHLNHSQDFWGVCEALSDNYEDGHGWMKQHASDELMRYG